MGIEGEKEREEREREREREGGGDCMVPNLVRLTSLRSKRPRLL